MFEKECFLLLFFFFNVILNIVCRYDLDNLKDRLQIQLQQLVTASLSTLHETDSERLRAMEREIVFLKLGQSSAQRRESDQFVQEAIQQLADNDVSNVDNKGKLEIFTVSSNILLLKLLIAINVVN